MITEDETVLLAWCDNGKVEGSFMQNVLSTVMLGKQHGIKFETFCRVAGNQIGRQRQVVFNQWADEAKTDWILWLDSDISIVPESIIRLWQAADKDTAKVVAGVYFVIKNNPSGMPTPYPVVYDFAQIDNEIKLKYLHPLPPPSIVNADVTGLGFCLMHKSIIEPLREKYKGKSLFEEVVTDDPEKFMGEDVSFFEKLKETGIQLKVDTGAIVDHVKAIPVNMQYYATYWNTEIMKEMFKG